MTANRTWTGLGVLQENYFLNYLFTYGLIYHFGHAGLSHHKLVLEWGGGEADKQLALLDKYLLRLKRNSLAHDALPAGDDRNLIKLVAELISPHERGKSILERYNVGATRVRISRLLHEVTTRICAATESRWSLQRENAKGRLYQSPGAGDDEFSKLKRQQARGQNTKAGKSCLELFRQVKPYQLKLRSA